MSEWSSEAHYHFDRTATTTMDEELMQLYGVASTELPILRIFLGKALVASAIPIGLWVIGASGRVDLLTATKAASIVNSSNDPAIAKWTIYESQLGGVPLTPPIFNDFIGAHERA
jgi:hypothetical protein